MEHEPVTLAAIDTGSNGIKMLIGEIDEHGTLWELDNHREAVRLGSDAFGRGTFSPETLDAAVGAFTKFRDAMSTQGVEHVRAVATSACRNVDNADELVKRVAKATGIELEIIDGVEEARLVFQAISRKVYLRDKDTVLIDMGGGSVEISVVRRGRVAGCETLAMGPVRLMRQLADEGLKEGETEKLLTRYEGSIRGLIQTELGTDTPQQWIGTGGNIQTLGQLRTMLCNKGNPAKIKPADLDKIIDILLGMKVDKRIKHLRLKSDRADVIAIAAIVMRMILRECNAQRLLIPDVGLRHGLLHDLANRMHPKRWVRPGG